MGKSSHSRGFHLSKEGWSFWGGSNLGHLVQQFFAGASLWW